MTTTQNRYREGKIYSIRSYLTEQIYIGSTCEPTISHRFAKHKQKYKEFLLDNTKKKTTSKFIFAFGDAYVELIELFPCNTKDELMQREGFHIRNNNCVNKRIEGRTKSEYYNENSENILIKNKQYRINNKNLIKASRSLFYTNNKEEIRKKHKQYNVDNKEAIKKRKRKVILCFYCNSNFKYGDKTTHIKTIKHIKNYKLEYLNCWGVEFNGVLDSEDY